MFLSREIDIFGQSFQIEPYICSQSIFTRREGQRERSLRSFMRPTEVTIFSQDMSRQDTMVQYPGYFNMKSGLNSSLNILYPLFSSLFFRFLSPSQACSSCFLISTLFPSWFLISTLFPSCFLISTLFPSCFLI